MYSVIDIESNGAGFRDECIIEVAIYKYDGHEIVDQFISIVNPESEITPFVQKLTGITQNMVKSAPKFHEIAKRIIEITEGTIMVGHNVDFDFRMLRQSFKRLAYDYTIETIDTIPLARNLIQNEKSYSLSKLCKSIGIPLTEKHRAGGDARATLELFKLLLIKDQKAEIIQKLHEETNAKSYLTKIKLLTEDIPAEKGIIYFQTSEGAILDFSYVPDMFRFSKNVFNSKSGRWKNIQENTEQINYDLVGNDLIAKLLMLNKKTPKKEKYIFGLYHDGDRYFASRISLQKNETPFIRFKNYSQAAKVVDYVNAKDQFSEISSFSDFISLKNKDGLWHTEGRKLGEKFFLIMQNGQPKFFGFYDLHHQIKSLSKISKLKIEIVFPTHFISNDLQIALLKDEFTIEPLPK